MIKLVDSSLKEKSDRNIFRFSAEILFKKVKYLFSLNITKFVEYQLNTKRREWKKTEKTEYFKSNYQLKNRILYLENYLLF
jgi:hypothetical protein